MVMKATVVAHAVQGLVKYHGLRDVARRIPFHDSISVCAEALRTVTTVEADDALSVDSVTVNGRLLPGGERARAEAVLEELRRLTGYKGHFKVVSLNSLERGKGLGFSASGFAALGKAAGLALGAAMDEVSLSEAVRLGAGSATRSLAGGFAIWYADRNGRSYAEQLAGPVELDLGMVVVPIPSDVRTDEAHAEVLSSPLFEARLSRVNTLIEAMKDAVRNRDIASIGQLAEEDSLSLHAITMTGSSHIVLWEPETIRVLREVLKMKAEGIPAWYSMDTGPSVFINTFKKHTGEVAGRLRQAGTRNVITSAVGDKPKPVMEHLF